jgi:16S rRNA (uracil1498-N3)-methyltransferase
MPQLQMAMSTKQIIEQLSSDKFVLIFDAESDLKFADITMPSDLSAIYLIIGPEGGISDEELAAFKRLGAPVVKLGEPVLRSAHAGFAALAAVQSRLGRW